MAEKTIPEGPPAFTLAFGIEYERMLLSWLDAVDRRYVRKRSASRVPQRMGAPVVARKR